MDKEQPEVLSREEVFGGKLINVVRDTVREGEQTYLREVVRHPGGAAAVPFFEDGSVAFVSQYRHPARKYTLELPAGKLDPGERPAETAARELEEELGVVAGRLEPLSEFYTTPGFCGEKLWVFLATELRETEHRREEDEIIEVVRMPFARALEMAFAGEFEDAKTIIGLLLAARRLGVKT
ncbi:MAG: NUDIX hydrolase [Acidobacteria bacterium]|nr:NUDIX hydrolase [Acidobacteriota bacterium]